MHCEGCHEPLLLLLLRRERLTGGQVQARDGQIGEVGFDVSTGVEKLRRPRGPIRTASGSVRESTATPLRPFAGRLGGDQEPPVAECRFESLAKLIVRPHAFPEGR